MEWDSNPRPKTAGIEEISLRQRLRPLGHPSVSLFLFSFPFSKLYTATHYHTYHHALFIAPADSQISWSGYTVQYAPFIMLLIRNVSYKPILEA
jgi:hypothetical protein